MHLSLVFDIKTLFHPSFPFLKHVIEELLIFKLLRISIVATITYRRAALNLHQVLELLALRTSVAVNIIGIFGALFT
jgi:hypothetical protein